MAFILVLECPPFGFLFVGFADFNFIISKEVLFLKNHMFNIEAYTKKH